MATHIHPDDTVLETPSLLTSRYKDAAARANAGPVPTTGVSQPAEVVSTVVVDLTDKTDVDDVDSRTILGRKVEV